MLLLLLLSGCFFGDLKLKNKVAMEELISAAIMEGDRDKMFLLINHLEVDEWNKKRETILHEVIMRAGTSKWTVFRGDGCTLSAEEWLRETCELLLDRGCDINAKDLAGRTALMCAILAFRDRGLCELLLSKGQNINAQDNSGKTALMYAVSSESYIFCELLLDRGCDTEIKNFQGRTALMCALGMDRRDRIVRLLLGRGCSTETQDSNGNTALLRMAVRRDYESCKLLLDRGCKVDAKNFRGETALIMVIKQVALPYPDHMVYYGGTDVENRSLCKLLLDNKCDVDAQDHDGKTALIHAAGGSKEYLCSLLLDNGCDVNAQDKSGKTALICAILSGSAKTCGLLLHGGASAKIAGQFGENILEMCLARGFEDAAIHLVEKGAIISHASLQSLKRLKLYYTRLLVERITLEGLFDALFSNYQEGVNFLSSAFLTENFIKVKNLNKKSFNGLELASVVQNLDVLSSMLGHSTVLEFINGADNTEALSPLRLALKYGQMENAKLLLAHGALPIYKRLFFNVLILEKEPALVSFMEEKALLVLLKLGRVSIAKKLISYYAPLQSLYAKVLASVLNLKARDEYGRNAYHCLALYCPEDTAVLEFLNRSMSLRSFDRALLNQEDNEGFTPLQTAILASNPYFIQHVISLNLLSREELISKAREGQSIPELLLCRAVDKETVDAVVKYIMPASLEDPEELHDVLLNDDVGRELKVRELQSFLQSGGDINSRSEGHFSVLEDVIAMDDPELLSYIAGEREISTESLFATSLSFSSKRCLEFLCDVFLGYELLRGEGAISRVIDKVDLHDLCIGGKEHSLLTVLRFKREGLLRRDGDGALPLHVTAKKGRAGIARILLAQEEVILNIEAKDNNQANAIHCAAIGFSPEIVSMLFQKGCRGFEDKNCDGKRPIDLVVDSPPRDSEEESKRVGVIYALLCMAEEIEYDPSEYESVINLAIKQNEIKIVKELLAGGYRNYKDKDGATPLHLAVKMDNKEMVTAILPYVDNNFLTLNRNIGSPLHSARSVAIMNEYFERAIDLDVTSGTLLNGVDASRNGVLHSIIRRAADLGEEKAELLVKCALDNGADREKTNIDGLTTERLSRNLGLGALADLIKSYVPNFDGMRARERRREKARMSEQLRKERMDISKILNGEMDVNEALAGGNRRAVHYSIEEDSSLIQDLLELGANLMIEDKNGNTAYRLAASISAETFKELLVRTNFVDLLAIDSRRETPLHIGMRKGGSFERAALDGLTTAGVTDPELFYVAIDCRSKAALDEFLKLGLDIKAKSNEGKSILKYIIDSTAKAETRGLGEKDKLQQCFKHLLVGIERAEDLKSVILDTDSKGRSAMTEALHSSDIFYLSELLKRVEKVLSENTERVITKEDFYKGLDLEISKEIEKLLERPEHIMVLLSSYSGMSNILSGKSESTFGKAIYLAASRENNDAVRAMISSFVSFKSRQDIVYDKVRGYIPMIIQPVCVAFGLGTVGKVLENLSTPELSEKAEAIRFIDQVYGQGEWALDVEIIPAGQLLRYYKKAAKNFREPSREEVKRRLLAQQEGEAVNTRGSRRILQSIGKSGRSIGLAFRRAFNKELERSHSLLDILFKKEGSTLLGPLRWEYQKGKEGMQEEILEILARYSVHHEKYEAFVKENIRPVLKEWKEWCPEFGIELGQLYVNLMRVRRELKDRLYDYAEYLPRAYRAVKVGEERVSLV